jgi:hypothetical protein
MKQFNRGVASVTREVEVSADEFWAMLRDWPAVMKWNPRENNPTSFLLDVTLKPGDDAARLPCTRVMHFDTTSGFPPTYEEILLYAYPEARRIYYTFSGVPDGLTHYMATTFVDELDRGRARVTCTSMFDLPTNLSLADTVDWLEKVYDQQIIRGIEAAIKRERLQHVATQE